MDVSKLQKLWKQQNRKRGKEVECFYMNTAVYVCVQNLFAAYKPLHPLEGEVTAVAAALGSHWLFNPTIQP